MLSLLINMRWAVLEIMLAVYPCFDGISIMSRDQLKTEGAHFYLHQYSANTFEVYTNRCPMYEWLARKNSLEQVSYKITHGRHH